mgnify:CR=1 FL=1
MYFYKKSPIHFFHACMNSILSLIEVFDIELEQIAHHVIKHEEASSFLYPFFSPVIEQIENGSQYFVHSLNVLRPWIYLCENKEDAGHIVISICLSLLLLVAVPTL